MSRMRCLLSLLGAVFVCFVSPYDISAQPASLGLTLPRALNFATSPSPVGSGARAQGQALAFIGVADDATAASHNPGGLVQLEQPEISIVGSYFVRLERQDVLRDETMIDNQTLRDIDLNYVSVAYPFQFLQRSMVASVNFQRLFDFRGKIDTITGFTEPPGEELDAQAAGRHTVSSNQKGGLFTLSPALAVQITPRLSVGVAVNFWPAWLGNGWTQDVSVDSRGLVLSGNELVPFTSTGQIQEDFDFEGVNVTAGFLWTINSVFSLGGVFRSPFTARVTRTNHSSLRVTLPGQAPGELSNCRFTERLDMEMPMSYGLGLAGRLSTRLRLALDVSRTHWSDFRLEGSRELSAGEAACGLLRVTTPVGKGPAILAGQGDDTTSVRLGTEYLWIKPSWIKANIVIPLRAGLFYDPEPGASGTDTFWGFSFGTGVAATSLVVDLAYTFRAGTVVTDATDTAIRQHGVLASVIYHF